MSTLRLNSIRLGDYLKPALIGGSIGLAVIVWFLSQTHGGKPEFGPYWMLRPLIIVPVATAMGGAAFQFIRNLVQKPVGAKVMLTIFGLLVFVVSLWLGSVLGLAGTYWH
ncbi:hypothetical protein [Mucilaginibacter segetis]|uniref:Potassium transporter KefB n=1 Tax=Mucilaginibacter segetis TaxID=2793071 RepID=A0A934UMU9_9SPHI|nr:hypothetical protein [Mucilaginibacter segetis]MBK0379267.1 hypothetical protein [Mucilaginibacter segetis]